MQVRINGSLYTIEYLQEIYTYVLPENIKEANLAKTRITELPENFFKCWTQLESLCIGFNSLEELPENIFKYNTLLERLDIRDNSLEELPENIFKHNTNLKNLFLGDNKIKQLPENIFKHNTNLKHLILGGNCIEQLPENIFKYNVLLEEVDIGDNSFEELSENIFRYNINLKEIEMYVTRLEEFPENIFRNNTKLHTIYLDNNAIVTLPENIFKYNVNLYDVHLDSTHLEILPENIFKYNTNLYKLNLSDGRLTSLPNNIFQYNTNLHELILKSNKLKQLPTSLLNCNRLNKIDYTENEINYIPPNMQRFLNRQKNQSNTLQIYNDGQNVHNHEIQECVKNSINNILSIPKTIDRDKIMDLILESEMTETSKRLILEYCNDNTIHSVLCVTFEETLHHMFQYIVDHLSDKLNDIMEILDGEMQDSECKCFTGRISRLINCLGGISDLVEVKIPENMERSNIVLMLRNKYDGQELIDNITKEFISRGYREYIEEYIKAL